ncbi:MAG: methyltransferase domain-containing protein [Gammaproteobacteria bacterium]|nr:MAG: methyltransferase domain-containing protein [Gammaproteobacteria bacterium]
MEQPQDRTRRLHIGGRERREGWEILDALAGGHVDHVGDASDLSRFAEGTFSMLYASHVLEHFDYRDEIVAVLKEWRRVLRPGGKLFVSVPDLECLCRLYVAPGVSPQERFAIMRMIFGGHVDHYDYHMAGIDQSLLEICLEAAGFVSMLRVGTFNLFRDNSEFAMRGTPISLNMVAERSPA